MEDRDLIKPLIIEAIDILESEAVESQAALTFANGVIDGWAGTAAGSQTSNGLATAVIAGVLAVVCRSASQAIGANNMVASTMSHIA